MGKMVGAGAEIFDKPESTKMERLRNTAWYRYRISTYQYIELYLYEGLYTVYRYRLYTDSLYNLNYV
jgi:hypothetical protein